MTRRLETLTATQNAQMPAHAKKWIEIGLSTGAADRATFEQAARRCYEHAGVPWHQNVVWVSSPWVMALAAPIATRLIRPRGPCPGPGEVRAAVQGALRDTVTSAELEAVQEAVCEAARRAALRPAATLGAGLLRLRMHLRTLWGSAGTGRQPPRNPVYRALYIARFRAEGEVMDAVGQDASLAVRYGLANPVELAVGDTVGTMVHREVAREAMVRGLSRAWLSYFGGQLWVGGDWRPACSSFYREVCGLTLSGDRWERVRSYEETARSASWWYPHQDFLMVCEHPRAVHLEAVARPTMRGAMHQQLHCEDGPAVQWPDGWGIYALHGVRVPGWIIEQPQRIGVAEIESEPDAAVRRIMLERFGGWARYMQSCDADVVDSLPMDHAIRGLRGARLLRKDLPGEPEPIVYLDMVNSSPEPDGTHRHYFERIDPKAYRGDAGWLCHAAMASRWHHRTESGDLRRTFVRWQDYQPSEET
jgi:hypothetical protein